MMNDAITLETIVMIVGFAITILTFTSSQKKDIAGETKERTKMYTKVDETCNRINEILRSVDRMSDKFDMVSNQQLRHDEQIKTLFKTLDEHNERIRHLEEKCRSMGE